MHGSNPVGENVPASQIAYFKKKIELIKIAIFDKHSVAQTHKMNETFETILKMENHLFLQKKPLADISWCKCQP